MSRVCRKPISAPAVRLPDHTKPVSRDCGSRRLVCVGAWRHQLNTRTRLWFLPFAARHGDQRTMPYITFQHLGVLLPIAATADMPTLACALDRLADLALCNGRAVLPNTWHTARRTVAGAGTMMPAANLAGTPRSGETCSFMGGRLHQHATIRAHSPSKPRTAARSPIAPTAARKKPWAMPLHA